MKKLLPLLTLLALLLPTVSATAQDSEQKPTIVVIVPFKNLDGIAKYDSVTWSFPRALEKVIEANPNYGKTFELITVDDMLDQMLALNVEVNPHAVNYETDVFDIAERLNARLIIFGSYKVKYGKANFSVKVFDMKTMLPDSHKAERIIVPYEESLSVVNKVAEKILPAFAGDVESASGQ
jgi:TolB-like protein